MAKDPKVDLNSNSSTLDKPESKNSGLSSGTLAHTSPSPPLPNNGEGEVSTRLNTSPDGTAESTSPSPNQIGLEQLRLATSKVNSQLSQWLFEKTLSSYSKEDIFSVAQELLSQGSRHHQRLALALLGHLPPASDVAVLAVPIVNKILVEAEPLVAQRAITTLAQLAPNELLAHAETLIAHPSTDMRMSFASAARRIHTTASISSLLTLTQATESSVRNWSLLECHQLDKIDDPSQQTQVAECLNQDGTPNQSELISALAASREPRLVEYLNTALSLPEVAPSIVEAAEELGARRLYPCLWNLLWTWSGAEETLSSALRACKWDDPRPLPELIQAAQDTSQPHLSENAVGALQRSGSFEAFEATEELCKSPNPQTRLVGTRIFAQFGSPHSKLYTHAISRLSELLNDSCDDVIAAALEGIGITQEKKLAQAVNLLQKHEDPEIRNAVSVILYGVSTPETSTSIIALCTARETTIRSVAASIIHKVLNLDARPPDILTLQKETNESITENHLQTPSAQRPSQLSGLPSKERTEVSAPPKKKYKLIIALVIGALALIGIATATYLFLLHESSVSNETDNPELVESLVKQDRAALKRPTPEEILEQRKNNPNGMFEASRLLKLASMLRIPIQRLLNNKKECWYLYNRMDPQDAAWVLSRAAVPKSPHSPEAQNLRLFLSILVKEAGSDNHRRVANLLRHLAPQNSELSSYLLEQTLEEIPPWQQDDLALDFASIGTDLKQLMLSAGYKVEFHPALLDLTPHTRHVMKEKLGSGWLTEPEEALVEHLRMLNRGITIKPSD